MSLLKNVKVTRMTVSKTSGATDSTAERVLDMSGFDGVMFIGLIGSAGTTGFGWRLIPTHSSATSTTDQVKLTTGTGTAGTTASGAAAMEESCVVLDIYKPTKRYMSVVVDLASTNSEIDGVVAVQYALRKGPVSPTTTQYGTVYSAEKVSPTS